MGRQITEGATEVAKGIVKYFQYSEACKHRGGIGYQPQLGRDT